MATDLRLKVVQRGILLRAGDDGVEALLLENANGTWELPGGKISRKESALDNLKREVDEETGLTVTAAEPVTAAIRKHKKKKPRGKFGVVYHCSFEGEDVTVSDEHVGFAWMGRTQVERTNLAVVDEYRALLQVMGDAGGDVVPADIEPQAEATNGEHR